jgi:hypothetical protein
MNESGSSAIPLVLHWDISKTTPSDGCVVSKPRKR